MRFLFLYTFKGIHKFFTNKHERTFVRLALFYGEKNRYTETIINFAGFEFIVPDVRSFLWQFKEIFVEEYYRFNVDVDNPIIYDCGANVGTSCAYFKTLFSSSKIKAFEADPKVGEILRKNLTSNKIENVEIIHKAVWINNDGVEIGLEGADGSSIYLKNNTTFIPSIRLKDLLESETRIDFLKLDIEGAEFEVMNDCRKSLNNVKNIFIEFHSFKDHPQNLSEILKILEEANFRYYFRPVDDRTKPFINRNNKFNPILELQLNIFAYKVN